MIDISGELEVVAITDVGEKRTCNEDSIATDPGYGIVLVADGMGGHNAGEVASSIAANVIHEQLKNILPELQTTPSNHTEYTFESLAMKKAIELANSAIMQVAKEQLECYGMGTTIVSGLFYDNKISVAHVGDSRMYRLRGKRFEQLTKDHSMIQEFIDRGIYESMAKEAIKENSSLITRAVGVGEPVEVDLYEDIVQLEDIYLLCSDGLTDMVCDDKIYLTLNEFSANLKLTAEKLIEMANKNGGEDNISVILARPA